MGPLFLLMIAAAAPALPAPGAAPPLCVPRAEAGEPCPDTLAFRDDAYDRMTVAVQVGGTGPYRFLVDTGADRSAISGRLADALKLKPSSAARLHSAAGVSTVAIVRVPRLQLANRAIDGLHAPVLSEHNMGADGILGIDSLRSQRIVIDFRNTRMYLTPSLRREPRLKANEIVITGRLKSGHLIFTRAEVDGEPVTVVIDTGAQVSIGNEALRRLMERRRKLGRPYPAELTAVTGEVLAGNLHLAREIALDGANVRNVGIIFADAQTFRAIGHTEKPTLLLGMNALRGFEEVAIDLERKKLRLRIPRNDGSGDG